MSKNSCELKQLSVGQSQLAHGTARHASGATILPCFPDNKTGLILIFTPKLIYLFNRPVNFQQSQL